MKATITIDFEVDGVCPSDEVLQDAFWKLIRATGYIGSAEVDGTDAWGIEVGNVTLLVFQ
jgi:hypothetical protein